MARPERLREKDTWTATLSGGGIVDLGRSAGFFARLDRDDRAVLIKIPSTRYLERFIRALEREHERIVAASKLGDAEDAIEKYGKT